MFSCPDVFDVIVPGKSFDPLIKGRCYVCYRCQLHSFLQFKCKKIQTAAWLECCLLFKFSLSDVCIGSNIRVREMKEKGRLFPPGVFNQTKVEEYLTSLGYSQQSVLKLLQPYTQAKASDCTMLTEISGVLQNFSPVNIENLFFLLGGVKERESCGTVTEFCTEEKLSQTL